MIVIIGSAAVQRCAVLSQKIQQRGHPVCYFPTDTFPRQARLTYVVAPQTTGSLQVHPEGPVIQLSDVQAVFCPYALEFVNISQVQFSDPRLQETVYWDTKSALDSFFRSVDCLWVDPVETFVRNFHKAYQLKQLYAAGIRVPDTLISNDPEQLRRFYEKHPQGIICKSCWTGFYTGKITDADFTPERLATLSQSPFAFQEFIPGTDILAMVVQQDVFAAEIQADTVDFRVGQSVQFHPITLPDAVTQDCLKVAQIAQSRFMSIDLRRTPVGEYVFFEGTPSPEFLFFEQATGYPISDRLVDLLIAG